MNDQQLFNTINKITDTKSLFSMTGFSTKESPYENKRDELFYRLLNGWNQDRVRAGYVGLSKARLAIAINRNPFLRTDDDALEFLIKECEEKGNYRKAHFVLFK